MSVNLKFVLCQTSHPGNVGAAARAIKTMGFQRLVLVKPRFSDVLNHPDAIAFASGAQDILESAEIVDDVASALTDCVLVGALSARLREFSPPVLDARDFVRTALSQGRYGIHTEEKNQSAPAIALLFGSERYGLSNDDVLQAQYLVHIPTNPDYSSLNLAQALQIMAYEFRVQSQQAVILDNEALDRATHEQVEGMIQHLEDALVKLKFLEQDNPKKLMFRLRRMFARSGLEREEVNILRGISRKILDGK